MELAALDRFIQSLVDYADQIGDDTPLQQERDKLWVAIQNGNDLKTMVDSSVNGKTFRFQVTLTLEEKFHAFTKAIKIFNDDDLSSPITFIDFSGASDHSFSTIN